MFRSLIPGEKSGWRILGQDKESISVCVFFLLATLNSSPEVFASIIPLNTLQCAGLCWVLPPDHRHSSSVPSVVPVDKTRSAIFTVNATSLRSRDNFYLSRKSLIIYNF